MKHGINKAGAPKAQKQTSAAGHSSKSSNISFCMYSIGVSRHATPIEEEAREGLCANNKANAK